MPISFSVDHNHQVVLVRWTGVVSSEELRKHLQAMLSDNEAVNCRRSITDTRQAENLESNFGEILQAFTSIIRPKIPNGTWRAAVILNKPHLHGIGRQFQAAADGLFEISLFSEEHTALEWITQLPPA